MLRMGQVHVIRHKVLIEGQEPVRRRYKARARPVWQQVQARLEELIAEWEPRTTAKQRLTGVRLYRALREEGYQVGLTMIHEYLRERRRQRAEVFVPLICQASCEIPPSDVI